MTRTLVYKRTHHGDPNDQGVFGCHDCMGRVRGWSFDAVIGIGGIGPDVEQDIAGRINWIGVGANELPAPHDYSGPLVVFDHFLNCNSWEEMVRDVAPNLAARMYDVNVRATTKFDRQTQREIVKLLAWAEGAAPSLALAVNALRPQIGCQPQDHEPLSASRATTRRNRSSGRCSNG
jgi:hypothetical protein